MIGLFSNDPFIESLHSFGYNVVRLPKTSVKPSQLYSDKKDELFYIGELTTTFRSRGNVGLPTIAENQRTSSFANKESGKLSLGLGFSILKGIISTFGGLTSGLEKLEANYQSVKSIAFKYENVMQDNISIAELDQFLSDADINPYSRYVADLLESDKIYAITSTLKSNKFTILPKGSKGIDLKLKIPLIQQIVGSNLKVMSNEESESAITFEGNTRLVFGFQAQQLFYENGKYSRQEPAKKKKVMLGPKKGRGKLLTQSAFINIQE